MTVSVKCDDAFDDIIEKNALPVITDTPDGKQLRVTGEEQAKVFLEQLLAADKKVVRFELREPSLNEIFIEKVGAQNEEE